MNRPRMRHAISLIHQARTLSSLPAISIWNEHVHTGHSSAVAVSSCWSPPGRGSIIPDIPVMRDVNPLCFLDLLLQMCESYIVDSICFKNLLFGPFTYWFGFSHGPREFRIFSHLNWLMSWYTRWRVIWKYRAISTTGFCFTHCWIILWISQSDNLLTSLFRCVVK